MFEGGTPKDPGDTCGLDGNHELRRDISKKLPYKL